MDGVWTAWRVSTGLAVVTVLLEARGWMVIKGVQRKDNVLLGLPPTSSMLLSFWVSVTAGSPGVILAPSLCRIIPTCTQLPRSRELPPGYVLGPPPLSTHWSYILVQAALIWPRLL